MKTQQGFTMIELMISLVLALLIIAAVVQVYIISTKTATMQQAASGILDNNVFGLQQVEQRLRMAGLGLGGTSKNNAVDSGILITPQHVQPPSPLKGMHINVMTEQQLDNSVSNVNGMYSDQLTIQYRAPMDMRDCEGHLALGPREAITDQSADKTDYKKVDGQVIVERYYVYNNNGRLQLRCDAGRYVTETITAEHPDTIKRIKSKYKTGKENDAYAIIPPYQFSGIDKTSQPTGVLVADGIDLFKVQLAVADGDNTRYLLLNEYKKPNNAFVDKAIVGVKLGIITSGDIPLPTAEAATNPSYILFGQERTLKSNVSKNQVRRVYESNVMLRNSRDRK